MKTTIEVSDALFNAAKALAQQKQTTLRALVEQGLRLVLADSQPSIKPAFKLKNASVGGESPLISDPRQWQQFEEEHVTNHLVKPQ